MRTRSIFIGLIAALTTVVACGSGDSGGGYSDSGTQGGGDGSAPDATMGLGDAAGGGDAGRDAIGDTGAPDGTVDGSDSATGGDSSVSMDAGGSEASADGATSDGGSDAESDTGIDAGDAGGSSGDSGSVSDAGAEASTPIFGGFCDGGHTTLTGVVVAPNGVDPIPHVRVYAAAQVNPYPASYCDKCALPVDTAYASTITAPDGSFTMPLDAVPFGPTITFAIQIGRFRKVTPLPVTPCQGSVVPAAARTLPGSSAAGDIPRIAVSSGNQDHLDAILAALGITEYDCYEGRKVPGASTATCQQVPNMLIPDVLSSSSTLDGYHMLFLSCAPGAYAKFSTTYNMATITQNTASWVSGGGRMFATDTAYDYVEQPFPDAITFGGPTAPAGVAQPVDGANIGCSTGVTTQYAATVDDPALTAWLQIVGFPASPSVQIQGFIQPWSIIASLPMTSPLIADGTMSMNPTVCGTSADVPLTTQFDYGTCGRVAYSSYHTLPSVNVGGLAAQEKIMEYLIFQVATCRD